MEDHGPIYQFAVWNRPDQLPRGMQPRILSLLHHPRSTAELLIRQDGTFPPNWLLALPISDHSFHLHKSDFRDTICLRYIWIEAKCLPDRCLCMEVCSVLSMQYNLCQWRLEIPLLQRDQRSVSHAECSQRCATLCRLSQGCSISLTGETFPCTSVSKHGG